MVLDKVVGYLTGNKTDTGVLGSTRRLVRPMGPTKLVPRGPQKGPKEGSWERGQKNANGPELRTVVEISRTLVTSASGTTIVVHCDQ